MANQQSERRKFMRHSCSGMGRPPSCLGVYGVHSGQRAAVAQKVLPVFDPKQTPQAKWLETSVSKWLKGLMRLAPDAGPTRSFIRHLL